MTQFSIEQLEGMLKTGGSVWEIAERDKTLLSSAPAIAQQLIETMRELEALKAENDDLRTKLYAFVFEGGDENTRGDVFRKAVDKWKKMEAENKSLKERVDKVTEIIRDALEIDTVGSYARDRLEDALIAISDLEADGLTDTLSRYKDLKAENQRLDKELDAIIDSETKITELADKLEAENKSLKERVEIARKALEYIAYTTCEEVTVAKEALSQIEQI